jgi:methyltransferase family protein
LCGHNASRDAQREPAGAGRADRLSRDRARALRREVLLMRAFQSRVTGTVLRRIAKPQNILELGMAFWSSPVVLSAVEFGVFTKLAAGPLSAEELTAKLGWQSRAAGPVLDALVVLGLLGRDRAGRYSNSRRSALFLDRAKPGYLGGLMELSSKRLFNLWSGLGDLLQTGRPEAGEERGDNEFFSAMYRDPAALKSFLTGMTEYRPGRPR